MKKFFKEFKEFLNRGNVLDLAVAVIIGGAFSAIVTALTNKVIMPLINLLLSAGGNGLEAAYTILKPVYLVEGDPTSGLDLTKSIYIDWGAFITAIIEFVLIALVVFMIVKVFNASAKRLRQLNEVLKAQTKKEIKEEKRQAKIKAKAEGRRFKEVWNELMEEKKNKLAEQERILAEQAKLKEQEDRLNNPTEKDLLMQIRDLLAKQK